MRLIVTRPRAQAAAWVRELRALGVDAVALPLIEIAPVDDVAALHAAWQRLRDCALIFFVSPNAVQHFMAAAPAGSRWPRGVLAGSPGPGTSAALRGAGVVEPELVEPAPDAPTFDSEALWAQLAGRDWVGRRVLVVRGEQGRDWLADTLRERGATVDFIAAYRRQTPRPTGDEEALLDIALAAPAEYLWHFSSSQAVAWLRPLRPDADWSRSAALASHPRIAQAARDAGFGRVEAVAADARAVAARVAAWPAGPASIESSTQ